MKTQPFLVIEFKGEDSLLDFVNSLRHHGLVPLESAVYCCDSLDGSRLGARTYILRKDGDRPETLKLKP